MLSPLQPRFPGKVVILVDEVSLSQAEYTAMALRASPNAVVVGSTTAGADGNVSPIPLPGGLSSTISGIGVFYPDRTPTQRVGIVPDVEVRPTIAGVRAGRDEVLEAGVSHGLGREWRQSGTNRSMMIHPEDPYNWIVGTAAVLLVSFAVVWRLVAAPARGTFIARIVRDTFRYVRNRRLLP